MCCSRMSSSSYAARFHWWRRCIRCLPCSCSAWLAFWRCRRGGCCAKHGQSRCWRHLRARLFGDEGRNSMSTRLTSRNGVMAITMVIATVCGLALLSALATQGFSERTLAANLLAISFVVFTVGGVLFAGRAFLNWQIDEASTHLDWERGLIIAAVVAAVLGLALLEDMLRAAGEPIWSRVGMVAYLLVAAVVVTAETAYLGKRDWVYPQIVLYVLLGFLAQAAFG